jgi:hypothetical protein
MGNLASTYRSQGKRNDAAELEKVLEARMGFRIDRTDM